MTPDGPPARCAPWRRFQPLYPLVATLLGACTPIGAWLYEDPRFTLVEVRRAVDTTDHRFQFVMDGCNTNDYDLQADSMVTYLRVNGQPAGESHEASSLILPSRTVLRLSVKLAAALSSTSGTRQVPFTLNSETKVLTPLGPRRVALQQRGTVTVTNGEPVSWTVRDAHDCHPGQSLLPAAAGRGAGPPVYTPPPPPPPSLPGASTELPR